MILAAILYTIAFCLQTAAAAYAINLFFRARAYRLACGFLALGLGLMTGRRISPLLHVLENSHINLVDAWLSIPISLLLLLGMFQFKKLLIELEGQQFLLEEYSKIDSLTLAMSRPETFARAGIEIERSFRNKQCVAFVMIDIDHFKIVNDTYGHPAGDITLTNLVKLCQDELRAIDILGRVGGEEFLLVLPAANVSQATEVAERLRKKVAQKSCASWGEHQIEITISVGIAVFDPCVDTNRVPKVIIQKYYEACDHAMYRAKAAGRNQVCVEQTQ
jgi:diguanylate cyclase (GGDEF)-like protein